MRMKKNNPDSFLKRTVNKTFLPVLFVAALSLFFPTSTTKILAGFPILPPSWPMNSLEKSWGSPTATPFRSCAWVVVRKFVSAALIAQRKANRSAIERNNLLPKWSLEWKFGWPRMVAINMAASWEMFLHLMAGALIRN